MPDRIDIDALLIGALYGELTPADEALLAAHLESHPVDRSALADLTRTRAAIRDSGALAFHLEPSQGVSALLLREASRRAPRPNARDLETRSWFHRFTRTFMAHPAMAAAALVVLVVGVAGTLYLHGVDQFAEPAPPELPRAADTVPAPAVTQAPAAGNTEVAPASGAGSASTGGVATPSDRADLDRLDGVKDERAQADELRRSLESSEGKDKLRTGYSVNQAPAEAQAPQAPGRAASAPPSRLGDPRPAKKASGIEIRGREPSPRELREEDDEPSGRRPDARSDSAGASPAVRVTRGATAGSTRGAPAAAPAPVISASDQGAAPAPDPGAAGKPAAVPAASLEANIDAKKPTPAGEAKDDRRFAGKPAGAKDTAAEKAARDKLLEWARKQHGQVVALVSSNNCRAAASAAVEIYSRAPEYYAANVVTDRSIKPCLAYLNNEREREERSRAAAKMADPAAPAPPPTRK